MSGGPIPGWYQDPATQHELRYWNGSSWTEHVADQGVTALARIAPGTHDLADPDMAEAADDLPEQDDLVDASDEAGHEQRRRALERAVGEWTGQLIDLGGRNSLLYFKDLKVGSMSFDDAVPTAVDSLLDGRTVTLSSLFPGVEQVAAQARRCRALRSKAKENFEERGLQTLHLGVGMATWTSNKSASTPAAPVLLRLLTLSSRGGAEEDFDLALANDWEVNPTLLHMLRAEFGVDLDGDDLLSQGLDDQGRIDPPAVYEFLEKSATDVAGFATTPRVIAANLSYAKMPMVADLQGSLLALLEHPLICALAGSATDKATLRAAQQQAMAEISKELPDHMPPGAEFLVLDADASQSHAVNLALAGANLVVQGPPGTGKSQTIANLIAGLVAAGRSVLFVAEKRAAIDAVLNRLRPLGLADLVLDLHEGTGSRKVLATDLGRALQAMGQVPVTDFSANQRALESRRTELNAHVRRLHERHPPWNESYFTLEAMRLAIPEVNRAQTTLDPDTLALLDEAGLAATRDEIAEWVNLGGPQTVANPRRWARAAGRVVTPEQALAARRCAEDARTNSVPQATQRIEALVAASCLRSPASFDECTRILGLLASVARTAAVLRPEAYEADLDALVAGLSLGDKPWISRAFTTALSGRYRTARKKARGLCSGPVSRKELLPTLVQARDERSAWSTLATDGGRPRPAAALDAAQGSFEQLQVELAALGAWLGGAFSESTTLEHVRDELDALAADEQMLHRLPRLEQLRSGLAARGLAPLLDEIATRGLGADAACDALLDAWSASLSNLLRARDSRLAAFSGEHHGRLVHEFQAADTSHIESAVARVRRAAAERGIEARNAFPEQSDVLEHNARLRSRHRSVRDLLQMAPDVLLAARPCWVMSPLVVAQLLPGDRPYFDVVVFDEASQIRPADAISAIARGRHAVVAGDSKQLPPTTFFDLTATAQDGDDGIGADGDAPPSFTTDMESILDAISALLAAPYGTVTLDWHYRSRDERLIAFSNAQPTLYDWALTTFPGSVGPGCLRHVLVPHLPGVGGTVDSSTDEVQAVVDLVREHAEARPDESLGVIAMGLKHAERIQESLRLARSDDDSLDEFMDEAVAEPFFVKNLERVQGDERDAIILTIGYPKSPDGRMQYRFGPLNQTGGERRLNVAITRARNRLAVISSFGPEDMDDDRLKADGAKMLKRFLAYAKSDGADLGAHAMPKPALNPFEVDVKNRLTAAGIPLVAQYGVAGYWIDFAAKHPTRPGEMVLAIEADGVTYHSSETARQRDRLRQTHLERLGWRFHRIWSMDWFQDPDGQVAKAKAAYDASVAAADNERSNPPPARDAPTQPSVVEAPAPPARTRQRPPVPRGLPIVEYSPEQLDAVCEWIMSDTLLRPDDDLLEALMAELGFRRRGGRIVAALNDSIRRTRR